MRGSSGGELAAFVHQEVGGDDADAAAVGQDRQPLVARGDAVAQGLGGVEQFAQAGHAHQPGAREGGIVDRGRARHRAGVRGRGLGRRGVPPRLQHDHRLQPRHAARRRHELAGLRDALDIHQHGAGLVVARQHVEHVAEIDVAHVAHRDQVREADALGRPPVGQTGQHGARLRHRRDPSGLEPARPEAGIQSDARHGVADAVRPDDPEQMRPRRPQDALAPAGVVLARRGAAARAGGDDDGDLGAALAELEDQARHRLGRRHDDRQIGGLAEFGQALQHRTALDRAALDVQQMDLALEAAGQQVARDGRTDRAGAHAGADRDDRPRGHHLVEVAGGHGFVSSPTIESKP